MVAKPRQKTVMNSRSFINLQTVCNPIAFRLCPWPIVTSPVTDAYVLFGVHLVSISIGNQIDFMEMERISRKLVRSRIYWVLEPSSPPSITYLPRLDPNPYHASRADLLRRLSRFDEATAAYETALSLTTNRVEQNYIRRRLAEMSHKKSQKDHQAAQN